MADLALDVGKHLPGIGLIPASVQLLGRKAELDDEVARQVLRLDLAALFAPEPDQGCLVVAHDDPGVRAADESTGGLSRAFSTSSLSSLPPRARIAFAEVLISHVLPNSK